MIYKLNRKRNLISLEEIKKEKRKGNNYQLQGRYGSHVKESIQKGRKKQHMRRRRTHQ